MNRVIFTAIMLLLPGVVCSQSLAVNTDGSAAHSSAMLEVKSTSKGMLVPRMAKAQKNAIASPATGLLVYQTGPDSSGFHYYTGTAWLWLVSTASLDSMAWSTRGNIGTDTSRHFIGTRDNMPLRFKQGNISVGLLDKNKNNFFIGSSTGLNITSGQQNVGMGDNALNSISTGTGNTAVGSFVMRNARGSYNTAMGNGTLVSQSSSNYNVALGAFAMSSHKQGDYNVALGYNVMNFDTAATQNVMIGANSGVASRNVQNNVAVGYSTMAFNRTGSHKTAVGAFSLLYDTSAYHNTALGSFTLLQNTAGYNNIAVGGSALQNNLTGCRNIAIGDSALYTFIFNGGNDHFTNNMAIGYHSLHLLNPAAITEGNQNTAIGNYSGNGLVTGSDNTFVGYTTGGAVSGSRNSLLGKSAAVTAAIDNATGIGANVSVDQSNSMVFGDGNVTRWGFGINTTGGNILEFNNAVTTASLTAGGVWTNASDRTIKTGISYPDSRDILARIMQLPVSRWSYIKEGKGISHIGPMAQDFYRLFNTGANDKTISTIDPAGVALLGIQELKKENEALKKELQELRKLVLQK